MSVLITSSGDKIELPLPADWEERITQLVELTLRGEESEGEVSILITDQEQIEDLNRRYRNRSGPTDVLSFPQDLPDLLGDIVLCQERILEQAREYGHSPLRELSYLIIHGLLHLMSYSHQDPEAKKRMRAKEEHYLNQIDLEG